MTDQAVAELAGRIGVRDGCLAVGASLDAHEAQRRDVMRRPEVSRHALDVSGMHRRVEVVHRGVEVVRIR